MDLSGLWNYRLDPNDKGESEGWFTEQFALQSFQLPGTTAENKIGTKLDRKLEKEWTKDAVASFREYYSYRGVLWLQREVVLDQAPDGPLSIFFERILGSSEVWINGEYMSKEDSMSTPHIHTIPHEKYAGKTFVLTVKIDNRNHHHLGELASGYTDQTQTFWCGIVGKLFMTTTLVENKATVYFDTETRLLHVFVKDISDADVTVKDKQDAVIEVTSYQKQRTPNGLHISLCINNELHWNEFTRNYYIVEIVTEKGVIRKPIGIVDLATNGKHFTVNKQRIFLRGTLDCAIFPQTGYPPTDQASWMKIFGEIKACGLNHIRFHSWCPPEAAFLAANELGIYLMPEGPFWLDEWFNNSVGDYEEHYSFIEHECKRIIETYGHHPSFCFFAVGNELHGDFPFLAKLLSDERFKQQEILTTVTANTTNLLRDFYQGADDFFVGVEYEKRGLRGNRFLDEQTIGTNFNYENSLDILPVPTIAHEIGQYASYPDLTEMDRLKGVLSPTNLLAIKHDLQRNGLANLANDFLMDSQKTAYDMYKNEVESMVRSDSLAGYQLLGLQDYPGQNTAMVGFLDSSWEQKGIIEREKIYQIYGPVIPMIELEKRVFEQGESILFHYGLRNDLLQTLDGTLTIRLKDESEIYQEEQLELQKVDSGYGVLGQRSWQLPTIEGTGLKAYTFEVIFQSDQGQFTNEWKVWVDHSTFDVSAYHEISTNQLTPQVIKDVNAGDTRILHVEPQYFDETIQGNYFPVFWSPVFFTSSDSVGTHIEKDHPLFKYFATDRFASMQWKELIEDAVHFPWKQVGRIVQTVPNFFNHEIRTYLAEVKMGKGNIILSGFSDSTYTVAQKSFQKALYQYALSNECQPTTEVDVEEIRTLLGEKQGNHQQVLANDLAYRKPAWCDNQRSNRFGASKGNDGNPSTHWTTAAQTGDHYWAVDLTEIKEFKRIIVEPIRHEHMQFWIEASNDQQDWWKVAESNIHQKRHEFFVQEKARYLKVHYIHPLNISPGQRSFQVYEE